MKKENSLTVSVSLSERVRIAISAMFVSYAKFLSSIVSEEISVKRALHVSYACLAFCFLVFSCLSGNLPLLSISIVWTIITCWEAEMLYIQEKKGGHK